MSHLKKISLPDGEYLVKVDGKYHIRLRLVTRVCRWPDLHGNLERRILMVKSHANWLRKSGHEWCSFAFYDLPGTLTVWQKFKGTKKRWRDWDAIAQAFREQVIMPFLQEAK